MAVTALASPAPPVRREIPPVVLVAAGLALGLFVAAANADALAAAARAATFAGVLVAVGVCSFVVLAHDGAADAGEAENLRRRVTLAAGVAAWASLAQVAVQVRAIGGDWASLGDGETVEFVLRSNLHVAAVIRLCGLALIAYAVDRWRQGAPSASLLMTNGALVTLASFLVTGHAATRDPRLLGLVVDLLHTLSAAVWVGGLVALVAVVRARRRTGQVVAAADMLGRFSRVMAFTVAALVTTAVALTLMELSVGELFSTSYGALVLAKSAVAVLVLALGAYNHRRLVPAVRAAPDAGWNVLMRTVRGELELLAVVLVLTGFLTGAAS